MNAKEPPSPEQGACTRGGHRYKASAQTKKAPPAAKRKKLPINPDKALLIRADFADERAWKALCAAMQAKVGDFQANVSPLSDRAYEGVTAKELVRLASPDDHFFVFVADRAALEDPEQAVLVVDLDEKPGRTFRVVPSEAWGIENNLSLANMEFSEFAGAVDEAGVFRGF